MKHVFAGILLTTLFVSVEMSASAYYNSMQTRLRLFGERIGSVDNVPLVDKLTNLLPFAMVAACFKECPGQTMMVLTGLLVYALCANDRFRSTLRKYNPFVTKKRLIKNESRFDDSLFIFESDDEDDLQDEEFIVEEMLQDEIDEEIFQEEVAEAIFEEELIDEELFFDDEYSDFSGNRETLRSRTIKFL